MQPDCRILFFFTYRVDIANLMNLRKRRYLFQATMHAANIWFFDNEEKIQIIVALASK